MNSSVENMQLGLNTKQRIVILSTAKDLLFGDLRDNL